MYKCVCGEEFVTPNKFNSHKSHCKVHLINKYGEEEYLKKQESRHSKLKVASAKGVSKKKQNAEQRKQDWINEQHICEKCGKIMTEYYGSGRFCSQSCANSREHTIESRIKTSETLKSRFEYVEYEDKLITKEAYQKIVMSEKCKVTKVNKGIENIKMLENFNTSPYNEYNRVWINSSDGRNVYTFALVDEDGKRVKQTVVPVYRYKVECAIGRKLNSDEVVHHIDGDKTNDDINNLEVMSIEDHNRLHISQGDYFNKTT